MSDISSVEQVLVRLFDTPGYQGLIVLVALAAGAAHALKPGHGKSITAAYLVGAHGRAIHAVYLAFVVAAMHTVAAILLALLWQGLRTVVPLDLGDLTSGLQVAAAVIVILVGAALVRRRGSHHHSHAPEPVAVHTHAGIDGRSPAHEHVPGPVQDHLLGHAHEHAHRHVRGHSHTSPDANPFTRRGLIALGLSGGLVPSPTVFLILVSGLVTGRVAFGVLLVVVFGLGMMVTIAAVGLLTLRGLSLVESVAEPAGRLAACARALPGVAAYLVVGLGFVYLVVGIRGLLS